MTNSILAESSYSHEIDVSIDRVDIADWLAHLGNGEFQRCCPPDHIACGFTHNDDGRPMSINVETVGPSLLIQHYVAEVFEAHLCRMVSMSDVFPLSGGRTQTVVIWTLAVEPVSEARCRLVNSVTSEATPAFLELISQHGQSFQQAAAPRQQASADHNRRETPGYAASIARAAKVRQPLLT
ncbi:MAG TPA: hypothetical protein VIX82_01040 [Solirubrobacteraceae bacterium]